MREFKSQDGKTWVARIHDGIAEATPVEARTGWEVIQFDAETGTTQRIAYRPSGWLSNASIKDLIEALGEGENVRAKWS